MYPSAGVIHLAPFSDETLYLETLSKGAFFQQGDLYGVDMSGLTESAHEEVFKQPVVGLFAPSLLTASTTAQHVLDFTTVSAEVCAPYSDEQFCVGADLAPSLTAGPQKLYCPHQLVDRTDFVRLCYLSLSYKTSD